MFRSKTPHYAPQNIRVFKNLSSTLKRLGGRLFYYADQKPLGTPKQVKLDIDAVERNAMAEVLNRVCTAADAMHRNVLFMIDAIDEEQRAKRLPNMYGHIFSRSQERLEMRRAIEPPMHLDSEYSAAIQFADWVAAIVGRAIEYQLLRDSECGWVGEELRDLKDRLFTKESKLHLLKERSIGDLHNWDILKRERPFIDSNTLMADPERAQQMELMFQKARSKKQ